MEMLADNSPAMREIRRPKPEIRKKHEIRNPSRSTLRSSEWTAISVGVRRRTGGVRETASRERDEPKLRARAVGLAPFGAVCYQPVVAL